MITLICGPMFSGKSTELIRQLERKHIAGKKVLYIRPNMDSRGFIARGYKGDLTNMADVKQISDFASPEVNIEEMVNTYDAIFVDEYFMIQNCALLCKQLPEDNKKCDIYFGGLLATAENKVWPETVSILPYCDEIVKLNAICLECGSEHANYSLFKAKKTTDLAIGDDTYKAVCRKCYKRLMGQL